MKPVLSRLAALLAFFAILESGRADVILANGGKPRVVIVRQDGATAPEQAAARELAEHLRQITGATFQIQDANWTNIPERAIIIGPGASAVKFFPEVDFAKLGAEEFVMRTKGGRLLLAGGRPRGTLYAVEHFLSEQCGVRWWTPWATNIPHCATLRVPDLNVRERPAFEYREPYCFQGFDPLWKSRNSANGEAHRIPAELGGCITYKGFCHTFYPLVPPEKHFATHPEWFSLLKGKRTHERGQLCLSNPELRDFTVGRVKEWLREAPDAEIISVTQNDWFGACECANCKAIDDAEGSPSGSMLAFVNYIAERIELEFPRVAVDTFAYQYTRKPPRTIKPRPNVIVRLCSIECNFREPLDHPSNTTFLADLKEWSKICRRLYIWDYVTDFKNYVNPHPNWFVLGPNARVFQKFGVAGVFEEGAYAGYGSEMGELRAWVLAQLLWNPQLDDRALINEFLNGYYGRAAAKPIQRYLELMHAASAGYNLRCFLGKTAPHLEFKTLGEAERLWQQAEKAVAHDPELLARVRLSHLPVRYALLAHWGALRRDCWEQNGAWPVALSRKSVADEFRDIAAGVPGKLWTQLRVLNEHGLSVEDFLKPFAVDPAEEKMTLPPKRLKNPAPPADLPRNELRGTVDLQDDVAALAKAGEWAEIRPDAGASDRRAVRMPGTHSEWAFRIGAKNIPASPTGKWKVYAVARVELSAEAKPDSAAFGAGVYDNAAKNYPTEKKFRVDEAGANYRSHLIGTFTPGPERDIFVSPLSNPGVKAVWVDRIFLVPAK
ncbi:MAG: DUF4838 domain-containing protein [Pedosphaera sp.]|nr:DUF4838 domain-containing protein [Pedosphaera sp.]